MVFNTALVDFFVWSECLLIGFASWALVRIVLFLSVLSKNVLVEYSEIESSKC